MNRQPTRLPMRIAATDHSRLRPKTTVASRPVATAVIRALLANQIVNKVFGLPCRSASGTYSIARRSRSSLPRALPFIDWLLPVRSARRLPDAHLPLPHADQRALGT